MKKSLYAIFFAALLVPLIPPVQQKAAEPTEAENLGGHAVNGEQIPDTDFEIDANGVLVKYNGTEEIVTVPDGVTKIGKSAFYKNPYIQKVLLPDTVTEIGAHAFYDSSIREIDLSKVKRIEIGAFDDCRMLEEVNLEAVEILGNEVFWGCKSLKTVTGLEQLQEIGSTVFLETQLWEDYWKDETRGDLWIVNGILLMGHHSAGTVVIPDQVTRIAPDAFRESKLEKVIIPDSVTEIGSGVFSLCQALTTVRMEDSVTHIGMVPFSGCIKLSDIRLSNALTSIDNIFYYCRSLECLTLPAAVKKVDEEAFEHCPKLKTLTIPPQLEEFADNVNVVNYSVPLVQTIYVTDIAEAQKLEGTIKKCGTKVAELALTEEKVVLCTGSKFALRFNSGAKAEKWRSSNKKVVAVDSVGNLYAVSAGTATITATIYGKEYKCEVTVK